MKAVIYARTSTNEQSTDNQVPVLKDWAKQRDFEVVEVYQEMESAREKDSESIIEISEKLKSTEESLRTFETMPFLNRVKYLFRL